MPQDFDPFGNKNARHDEGPQKGRSLRLDQPNEELAAKDARKSDRFAHRAAALYDILFVAADQFSNSYKWCILESNALSCRSTAHRGA